MGRYASLVFFHFPRAHHARLARALYLVQWAVALITASYYVLSTFQAPVQFDFGNHSWSFDVPRADRVLGRVITAQVAFTILIGLWRAFALRDRERRVTLCFVGVMTLIFLVPGVANDLSRSAVITRADFMNLYVVSGVLGVFLLLILHINTTEDRTTFMAKIVGVSFATFLLLIQWISINNLTALDHARDLLRVSQARLLFFERGVRSPDLVYARSSDAPVSPHEAGFARRYRHGPEGRPLAVAYTLVDARGRATIEYGFSYAEYRRYIHDAAAPIIYVLLIGGLVILVGFRFFFRGALGIPLRSLLDGVDRVNRGDLSVRLPVGVKDEFGYLSESFNGMVASIREARAALELHARDLESRVDQRTAELARLIDQQHGDYYLTSLLVNPLGTNRVTGNGIRIEFFTKQKKEFVYRERENEIGGDICIAAGIELRRRNYSAFINADAMGKSMQGAGGALVLGSVFSAMLERTRLAADPARNLSPQRWLKNAYLELQKVFEAFEGTMLISAVIGLVEEDTGLVYYINAEHPPPILYRAGRASLIPARFMYRKLGTPWRPETFVVQTLAMRPGDVLIAGSDGKDDVMTGTSDDGERIINDDENKVLRYVESCAGSLADIYAAIARDAIITDDFSLLRIEYAGAASSAAKKNEIKNILRYRRTIHAN